MDSIKKVIGVVLIIIAAVVAIHTVIEPLYYTSTDESPYNASVWAYINVLSAISIVLGVIIGYIRKSKTDENTSVQEFIAANTLFYGYIIAAIFSFGIGLASSMQVKTILLHNLTQERWYGLSLMRSFHV